MSDQRPPHDDWQSGPARPAYLSAPAEQSSADDGQGYRSVGAAGQSSDWYRRRETARINPRRSRIIRGLRIIVPSLAAARTLLSRFAFSETGSLTPDSTDFSCLVP